MHSNGPLPQVSLYQILTKHCDNPGEIWCEALVITLSLKTLTSDYSFGPLIHTSLNAAVERKIEKHLIITVSPEIGRASCRERV